MRSPIKNSCTALSLAAYVSRAKMRQAAKKIDTTIVLISIVILILTTSDLNTTFNIYEGKLY